MPVILMLVIFMPIHFIIDACLFYLEIQYSSTPALQPSNSFSDLKSYSVLTTHYSLLLTPVGACRRSVAPRPVGLCPFCRRLSPSCSSRPCPPLPPSSVHMDSRLRKPDSLPSTLHPTWASQSKNLPAHRALD